MSAGFCFFVCLYLFFSELGRPPMRPLYVQQDLQHLMLKELITCLDLQKPTCKQLPNGMKNPCSLSVVSLDSVWETGFSVVTKYLFMCSSRN